MIRTILSLTSILSLSALDPCGLDLPGSDAGEEAGGSDATTGSQTVGTQCTAILNELCSQASTRCAQGDSVSDCVSSESAQCCSSGNTCDDKSSSSQNDVDTCKGAIDTADCNIIVNALSGTGPLPAECQSLLHP